jgi:hypothetical protein
VKFFNFGNGETFHAFQWVTNCKALNVDAMIAAAFDAVKPEDLDISDTCEEARDQLSEHLEELFEAQFSGLAERCDADYVDGYKWCAFTDVPDGSTNSLLFPILAQGMRNIDFPVLAEALLVRAGKWNRDLQRPDIL